MQFEGYQDQKTKHQRFDCLIQREIYAQSLYNSLQGYKITKPFERQAFLINPLHNQDYPVISEDPAPPQDEPQTKGIFNEHSLLVLKGLSEGLSLPQTQKRQGTLQSIPMKRLKNVPKLALTQLSKIFIELLPNEYKVLTPQEFYQKYFKKNKMLQFYKYHNLELLPFFKELFYLRAWQKKNNHYLNRGYAQDYLPPDIEQILAKIRSVYDTLVFVYDKFGGGDPKFVRNIRTKEIKMKVESTFSHEATQTGIQSQPQQYLDNEVSRFFQSQW